MCVFTQIGDGIIFIKVIIFVTFCGMSYPHALYFNLLCGCPHIQDMILHSSNAVVYPGAACSVARHIWDQPPGGQGVNYFCPELEKRENAVRHNSPAYY